ncbi:MAG: flagellin, partial [Anaerovibrio sp.]|nr:flagellin [Anaerovibrio sp.]
MPTIGSYAQQLSMLNQLNRNYASMNKHMTAIATGNKINSAKDDASGFSIGKRMNVEIGALDQAAANTQTGASMLKVADGSMSNTLDILQHLK